MLQRLAGNTCVYIVPVLLVTFAPKLVAQSDALSLSSGNGVPGSSVSLPLTLTSAGGASAAALEWTLSYSPTDFTGVSVVAAGTALAAGKSIDCAAGASGQYICLIYGMNSTAISDGSVATATFTVSPTTLNSSSTISVVNTASSSGGGDAIVSNGSSGTVTISQAGPGPTLQSLSCSPSTVQTPGSTTCTITLTGAAPAAGLTATSGYSTSSGAQVTLPTTVTIPSGTTSTTFSAQIGSVSSNSSVTLTASYGSVTVSFAVTIIAAPLPSISGTVSPSSLGSGASVALTGTANATTTADASGNYTFAGLANGSYTITPSKTGTTFTPTSQTVTVSGSNITGVNFTATSSQTSTISGTISPASSGLGTLIQLSGAQIATASADASGNYSFTGLANGTYTVKPTKAGYTFSPGSKTVTVNGANVSSVNFTATLVQAGIVRDALVSADQGTAKSSVTTKAFSTTSGNELLLAFVSADYLTGSNTKVSSVTGAGLTWVLVARTNAQRGTSEIWRAFATNPLSSVTVTAKLSQSVVSSLTIMSFTGVNTSGTNGSGAIGAIGGGNGSSGAPTASLLTTRNNSLVVGVGNDYDNAISRTPGSLQTVVHQDLAPVGDTYWVQIQNSTTPLSGTTVAINDTAPTNDRYNLAICEIVPTS